MVNGYRIPDKGKKLSVKILTIVAHSRGNFEGSKSYS